MGTILTTTIVEKVGKLLNDRNLVRWTQADLLEGLNEAQRYIIGVKPNAYTTTRVLTCVAGSKQSVPADVQVFGGGLYNVANDGVTPGRIITQVKREAVDVPDPLWQTRTAKAEIRHVIPDDEFETVFWVYPPAVNGTKFLAKVTPIPADITFGDPISLPDSYEFPIMQYVLFRAYNRNGEEGNNLEIAQAYFASCMQFLGLKKQSDASVSAEQDNRGASRE